MSALDNNGLAPTAPVEASGSEREEIVEAIKVAMKDAWEDHASDTGCWPADIKRVSSRGPLRLMFTPAIWAQTTAEWAAETILRNRPQPSGKTREAVARVEAFLGSVRGLIRQEGHTLDPADLRALLSAHPLALGGQQGEERERIAKIIDPEAFVPMEDVIGMRNAFAKADAILGGRHD